MGPNSYRISKIDIMHSLLGGGICFVSTFFISAISGTILRELLINLGILGVIAFDSFRIARTIIIFGAAYLTCGFLGGIYTGYNVEGRLGVLLFITASVGFVSFAILVWALAYLSSPDAYIEILLPAAAGNLIGAYLGGYTIIWPYRHGEEPSHLEIELEEEETQRED